MRVAIAEIRIGRRLRAVRESALADLMESIERIGLQVPISVTSGVERRPGTADGVCFDLVAGRHRLEACRRLGWREIEATIVQMSPLEAQLWEIDENLCRADLTELERGEHLAERKRVYEELHPETRHGANREPSGQFGHTDTPRFSDDTAERTGMADTSVRRSIRRAERIDARVRDRIREMPEIADSGVELDALASLDPAQQKKAVALVETGQAGGIRDAKRLIESPARPAAPQFRPDAAAEEVERRALVKAWRAARQSVREWFAAEYLDRPVFDAAQ